jgi:hypothetical protein
VERRRRVERLVEWRLIIIILLLLPTAAGSDYSGYLSAPPCRNIIGPVQFGFHSTCVKNDHLPRQSRDKRTVTLKAKQTDR